eukprot:m.92593 g.92593  ORF g.92593 m.92593 type:complete len:419 (+) comp14951_c0_seq1:262-1518(+)
MNYCSRIMAMEQLICLVGLLLVPPASLSSHHHRVRPCFEPNSQTLLKSCESLLSMVRKEQRLPLMDFLLHPPRIFVEPVLEADSRSICTDHVETALRLPNLNNRSMQYTLKFAAEVMIPDYIKRTTWATNDPSEADLILLDACVGGGQTHTKLLKTFLPHIHANPVLNGLFSQHPERFIMIATFDNGVCNRDGAQGRLPNSKEFLFNQTGGATLLMNHGNLKSPCYDKHKDVSIPTTSQIGLADFPGRAEPALLYRAHQVFFSGKYSHSLRKSIVQQLGNQTGYYFPKHIEHGEYNIAMANSIFCLAPRGAALWSPRLDEAIKMGCIPVVIATKYDMPFSDLLNPTDYSIQIDENKYLTLPDVLQNLTSARRGELLRNVDRVKMAFRYPGLGSTEPDMNAAILAIYQAWRRALRVEPR